MIDAPLASGVPKVTVPAENDPLNAPPFSWAGGVSKVVPCTVALHGGVAGAPVAAQVAESFMTATTTEEEVRARKSANPAGAGKVV